MSEIDKQVAAKAIDICKADEGSDTPGHVTMAKVISYAKTAYQMDLLNVVADALEAESWPEDYENAVLDIQGLLMIMARDLNADLENEPA